MQADEAREEEGSSEFHFQEFGADLWSVGRHGGLQVGKEGGQFRKLTLEASLAAQWLVFCTSTPGDTALIPIREIRSHMPHAAAKKQKKGHPLWLQSGRGCLSQREGSSSRIEASSSTHPPRPRGPAVGERCVALLWLT